MSSLSVQLDQRPLTREILQLVGKKILFSYIIKLFCLAMPFSLMSLVVTARHDILFEKARLVVVYW